MHGFCPAVPFCFLRGKIGQCLAQKWLKFSPRYEHRPFWAVKRHIRPIWACFEPVLANLARWGFVLVCSARKKGKNQELSKKEFAKSVSRPFGMVKEAYLGYFELNLTFQLPGSSFVPGRMDHKNGPRLGPKVGHVWAQCFTLEFPLLFRSGVGAEHKPEWERGVH